MSLQMNGDHGVVTLFEQDDRVRVWYGDGEGVENRAGTLHRSHPNGVTVRFDSTPDDLTYISRDTLLRIAVGYR